MQFYQFLPHLHKWQSTLLSDSNCWQDAVNTCPNQQLTNMCKYYLGLVSLGYLTDRLNNKNCSPYYDIEIPTHDYQLIGVQTQLFYRNDVYEHFYYDFEPTSRRIRVYNEFCSEPLILDVGYVVLNYQPNDLKLHTLRQILIAEHVMTNSDVLDYKEPTFIPMYRLN